MTEQELEELERALRAATPEPWSLQPGDHVTHNGLLLIESDARALVAARNAAPALLADVRRLRARVKELEDRNV